MLQSDFFLLVFRLVIFAAVVYLWFAFDKLETKLEQAGAAIDLLKQEMDALKSRDQPSQ